MPANKHPTRPNRRFGKAREAQAQGTEEIPKPRQETAEPGLGGGGGGAWTEGSEAWRSRVWGFGGLGVSGFGV